MELTRLPLPVAEIGARLQILTPEIAPLKLQNILEPSHASINLFAAMLDEGRLRYVEWARLTTRDQEVMGASQDHLLKAWKPDKSGVVREQKDAPRREANVATDLLVHHALRRRGVCYAVAELMTFETHETLIQFLFDAYYKEPSEGYQRVTLSQLALCDREVHLRLSDQCRTGFPLGADGGLPCVEQLLLPRARGASTGTPGDQGKPKPNPKKRKNQDRVTPPPPKPAVPRQDTRPKKRAPSMPAALRGGVPLCVGTTTLVNMAMLTVVPRASICAACRIASRSIPSSSILDYARRLPECRWQHLESMLPWKLMGGLYAFLLWALPSGILPSILILLQPCYR